jgi:hypothetical protein
VISTRLRRNDKCLDMLLGFSICRYHRKCLKILEASSISRVGVWVALGSNHLKSCNTQISVSTRLIQETVLLFELNRINTARTQPSCLFPVLRQGKCRSTSQHSFLFSFIPPVNSKSKNFSHHNNQNTKSIKVSVCSFFISLPSIRNT